MARGRQPRDGHGPSMKMRGEKLPEEPTGQLMCLARGCTGKAGLPSPGKSLVNILYDANVSFTYTSKKQLPTLIFL